MDNERFTLDGKLNVDELCGGCHQWGCDPVIEGGRCKDCNRTEAEIRTAHGRVRILE